MQIFKFLVAISISLCAAFADANAAVSWSYSQFPIVKESPRDFLPRQLSTGRERLSALMNSGSKTHAFWGVDQVYVTKNFSKILYVKKDVKIKGVAPMGGWIAVGNDHILHLRKGKELIAFYARGLDSRDRSQILIQLQRMQSYSAIERLFIPCADAEVTNSGSGGFVVPQNYNYEKQIDGLIAEAKSKEGTYEMANCIANKGAELTVQRGQRAWQATKENLTYAYENPMAAATLVGDFLGSAAKAGLVLYRKSSPAYIASHPQELWADINSAFDQTLVVSQTLHQLAVDSIEGFSELPPEAKQALLCEIGGQVASAGMIAAVLAVSRVGTRAAGRELTALFQSIGLKVKALLPAVKKLWAAKDLSQSEKLATFKKLLSGEIKPEAIEKLSGSSTAVASAASPGAMTSAEMRALSSQASSRSNTPERAAAQARLKAIQAANANLTSEQRVAAIEKHLGLKLTQAQKDLIEKIHNTPCDKSDCTAAEIYKSLADGGKGYNDLKKQFPGVSDADLDYLYRSKLLGTEQGIAARERVNLSNIISDALQANQGVIRRDYTGVQEHIFNHSTLFGRDSVKILAPRIRKAIDEGSKVETVGASNHTMAQILIQDARSANGLTATDLRGVGHYLSKLEYMGARNEPYGMIDSDQIMKYITLDIQKPDSVDTLSHRSIVGRALRMQIDDRLAELGDSNRTRGLGMSSSDVTSETERLRRLRTDVDNRLGYIGTALQRAQN